MSPDNRPIRGIALEIFNTQREVALRAFMDLDIEKQRVRIVERLEERVFNPPLALDIFEAPTEFLNYAYANGTPEFQRDFVQILSHSLGIIITKQDLNEQDNNTIKNIAFIATDHELADLYSEMRQLASQGTLSGASRFDPSLEQFILMAIIATQPKGQLLDPMWEQLYHNPNEKIRNVAFSAIKEYSPDQAVQLLPDLLERGSDGESSVSVWYLLQEYKTPEDFAQQIAKLEPEVCNRVLELLGRVGLSPEKRNNLDEFIKKARQEIKRIR